MTVRETMLAETATALGLADAEPLAALSLAEIAWLRDAAYRAREREQAAVDGAIDQAMDHVPALVRGAVRRVLFP
jgi:hypothetical protein